MVFQRGMTGQEPCQRHKARIGSRSVRKTVAALRAPLRSFWFCARLSHDPGPILVRRANAAAGIAARRVVAKWRRFGIEEFGDGLPEEIANGLIVPRFALFPKPIARPGVKGGRDSDGDSEGPERGHGNILSTVNMAMAPDGSPRGKHEESKCPLGRDRSGQGFQKRGDGNRFRLIAASRTARLAVATAAGAEPGKA